jgi:hypothetical protein
MTDDQLDRLRNVEAQLTTMHVKHAEMESAIKRASEAIDAVKRDTSELVNLAKGASVFGKMMRWITVAAGGYLAFKGLKWWD